MVRTHSRLVSLVALASLLMARPVRCTADVNICAILGENLQRFYVCARAMVPKIVNEKFDEIIRMFPGKTQSQVTRMICKSVGDNSDIVSRDLPDDVIVTDDVTGIHIVIVTITDDVISDVTDDLTGIRIVIIIITDDVINDVTDDIIGIVT
ncbi:uncharacterized protein ISCGN_007463 [Ixodes scapularis]